MRKQIYLGIGTLALTGAIAWLSFEAWRDQAQGASSTPSIDDSSSSAPLDTIEKSAPNPDSVIAQWDHSKCRWHHGTKLQRPEWWLSSYLTSTQFKQVSSMELEKVALLLDKFERQMNDAAAVARRELYQAVEDKYRGTGRILGRHVSEDGSISVMFVADADKLKIGHLLIQKGECPSFDAALAREIELHDHCKKQVIDMITSF